MTGEPKAAAKIVKIESRFSKMALREGGKNAAEALSEADAFVESQRALYFDWVAGDLDDLEKLLNQYLRTNGSDAELNLAAYQKAAQIRDLGGTFGYDFITDAANSLCELLYRFRYGAACRREAVDTHLGAMKLLCARDAEKMPDTVRSTLLSGLSEIVAKFPKPQPTTNKQDQG